jgi:hypothetical protein
VARRPQAEGENQRGGAVGAGRMIPDMFHGSQKEIASLLKKAYVNPKNIIGSDTSFLVNTGEKPDLVAILHVR